MAKVSLSGVKVSGSFGPRAPIKTPAGWSSSFHKGIDLAPPNPGEKVPLYAIAGGRVTRLRDVYGALCVRIGDRAIEAFEYWHLDRYATSLGDEVREGDLVGYMGSTGKSTAVHLHFEHWRRGVAIDPLPLIQAQAANPIAPEEISVTDAQTIIEQNEAILELLRVPGQPYGYPQHAANIAADAASTAHVVQRQGEAVLALLRVPGQPYGYPQHAASLAGAALALVQQQAERQGVALDVDEIVAALRATVADQTANAVVDEIAARLAP